MTDPRLGAALAAALHRYRGTCELWTISEAACPIDHRVDAAAILGEHGVFLPEGLGPVVVGMAKEIATLRAALDGLVEAAERVLAYGRVRPFADAARDQLRSALAAAKESKDE